MSNKKFILNADDFGLTNDINMAIVEGYHSGVLKSASLCSNGEAFYSAINDIIPECQDLCIGIHLNIIEGTAVCSPKDLTELTDSKGNFNNGYLNLLLKSNNPKFLEQVELEFRAQIERIVSHFPVAHIDSHVHTHAIPKIFDLTCKLAKEYNIPYVRTQFERPYLVRDVSKHTNLKYPVNQIKVLLLNTFSMRNKKVALNNGLKTNDFLVGVSYTGLMNDKTITSGLSALKDDENIIVESLVHPYKSHIQEYAVVKNKDMKYRIESFGFDYTTYRELSSNQHEKI
ncbi:MAG: carbohydrate deacetylase [Candidatus Gastranaerophilaceae bacterium]